MFDWAAEEEDQVMKHWCRRQSRCKEPALEYLKDVETPVGITALQYYRQSAHTFRAKFVNMIEFIKNVTTDMPRRKNHEHW